MKCSECGTGYKKSFRCPECGHMLERVEKANKMFSHFVNRDEKMRLLVTGLIILDLETEASCEGGIGHIKSYPWVELCFTESSERMSRLKNILKAYQKSNKEVAWKAEKQIGGIFWIVPENKQLPLSLLHEGLEDLGWFLYETSQ